MSKRVKAVAPQELKLDAEETRLVLAWRAMDDRARWEVMGSAEYRAESYPRRQPLPALRLVGGAA